MIQYNCICDYCGRIFARTMRKPSDVELKEWGVIVSGKKLFCGLECYQNYRHDLVETRVGNLKQFQPK